MHRVFEKIIMTNGSTCVILAPMNILIGVCGSISAYKILDVVRKLTRNGNTVRVIMTHSAEKFVVPQTFHYLGAEAVYMAKDDFNPAKHTSFLHIELARWCDKLVIAPLSANTLAKLVHGEASDLLSSTFITMEQNKPILVFPAMNSQMLNHPFTRKNLAQLQKLKSLPQVLVHPTGTGMLACGESGEGRLASVEEIVTWTDVFEFHSQPGKNILITTGATLSPLDPVRYLTNASSGLTGHYLAKEYLKAGHHVHVLAGRYATEQLDMLLNLPRFKLERVITTNDMKRLVEIAWKSSDIYISSAAINDIEFLHSPDKLKKSTMPNALSIKNTEDILSFVIKNKEPHQKIIGFAAETTLSEKKLHEKWHQKPVDLLVGTKVHSGLLKNSTTYGFQKENAEYVFLSEHGSKQVGIIPKSRLAGEILSELQI